MKSEPDERRGQPLSFGSTAFDVHKWMAENRSRIAEELSSIVQLPSAAPYDSPDHPEVIGLLESAGLSVVVEQAHPDLASHHEYTTPFLDTDAAPRPNICARSERKLGPTTLFSVHFDVVPAESHPEPWSGRFDGTNVHGRGSADTKNNLVMLVAALRCARELKLELSGNVIVDVVTDEEAGGVGALSTLMHGRDPAAVVVLEPTSLRVHHGHRGCLGFTFEVATTASHMGSRSRGQNAIELATAAIERLRVLEASWLVEASTDPDFGDVPKPLQLNVSAIEARSWHGSTPSVCTVKASLGFLPNRGRAIAKAEITNAITGGMDERYTVTWRGIRNQGYVGDPHAPTARKMRSAVEGAGADPGLPAPWNVSCDARLYARLTEAETIIFGSGNLEDAHTDSESVSIDQILKGAIALVGFLTDDSATRTSATLGALAR